MKLFKYLAIAAASLFSVTTDAQAAWFEARTSHFILVTSGTEERAKEFAARLERFDMALRRLYDIADNPDLHNRPVAIYALEPASFMVACGCMNSGLLGWYARRLDSPTITVITTLEEKAKFQQVGYLNSQALLLHEYSHHFMLANTPGPYPYWYVEGFAEFNANTVFDADGSTVIGYPASYRGGSLLRDSRIPMRKLVAPEVFGFGKDVDQTYGRAWLMTHYLMVRPERSGQLGRYLSAMASGKPSLQAAQQAFGDLDAFDNELDRYIRADIVPVRIGAPPRTPAVTVRAMSEGEGRSMLLWLAARRGIQRGHGKSTAIEVMKQAQAFPDDARAQILLSETALLAKRYEEADQLATRALQLDPGSARALVLKGRIVTGRAVEANTGDHTAWATGRKWFARANRADPNWAEPFYRYYTSFLFAGEQVPENAVTGLQRAHVLAPENGDIAWAMIREDLHKGDAARARRLLMPLAFAPHRRNDDNKPAAVIALIDAGQIAEAADAVDAIWRKSRDGDDD
ncbi:hypothetical protein [Novosphingobium gossypii]|uniref:hypothetical protein n=1 Tax=Novosphingobium gossypii TaxID=1604774 RepID=UPI003D24BB95